MRDKIRAMFLEGHSKEEIIEAVNWKRSGGKWGYGEGDEEIKMEYENE